MILTEVMDEVAERLKTAVPRSYGWPVGTVQPPAAKVDFPEVITYDTAMGRGGDQFTLIVDVVVSNDLDARTTRNRIGAYMDGAGPNSVKAAVDGGDYTSCDSVRVTEARPEYYIIGKIEYVGVTFTLDVQGKGTD